MKGRGRRWVLVGVAAALIVIAATQLGRRDTDRERAPSGTKSTVSSSRTSADAATSAPSPVQGDETERKVQAQIAQLQKTAEGNGSGYDRSLFASWIDTDRDGCNTRCEVLRRQREASLPGLPGGGWESTYDGYTTDDPGELDIDHVVPLREAWVSGADRWGPDERRAFANDLEAPELIAVTAATNRSKGDRDPAEWQPPNDAYWCHYVASWVTVKVKWRLATDAAEARALANMARTCR